MRPTSRRLVATAVLALAALVPAAPALAQAGGNFPNLPGNGVIRRAIADQLAGVPTAADLPGLVDAAAAAATQPQPSLPPVVTPDDAATLDPAPSTADTTQDTRPASGRSSLPRTGAPAVALALAAIALMSGGRLLTEVVGRRSV